ncbi:hypothetical protein [Limnobacter litoralis]|uniref:Extensin-like C-terminal domain-containing protein n=1 Tax=Limnobacter litoralis TaxID=481366 RepID=A0ABQ5YQ80_9BURK|nr:hypothetical protein [Limnobacter litoralis]GLR25945.1 hypothetical protein GCM10007875_10330 [Limnobacter litoralis]
MINGVKIEFGPGVINSLEEDLLAALNDVVSGSIATGSTLCTLYFSSVHDQHHWPSRHVQGHGKAVDISRVNHKKIGLFYEKDSSVKRIVDALQMKFEECKGARENFGPFFKHKHGKEFLVPGHQDHIHFSVD